MSGFKRTALEVALDCHPWRVQPEHERDPYNLMLLAHLRYVANNGSGMDETELDRAQQLYDEVSKGFVLDYSPATGFVMRESEKGDGELMVRLAEVSDEQEVLLELPPEQPRERR